jgi:N-acetylglucosamine repressor
MEIAGKPTLLKKINKNIVLNVIRERGPMSRAKLSRITNISKPTMSNIINSLKKDNLIEKVGRGKTTPEGGKRPILYQFNKNFGYVIGSHVQINEIVTILTDYNANIKSKTVIKISKKRDEKSIIRKLLKSFDYVVDEAGIDKKDLKGIGIGVHGVVDHKKGVLIFAPHFPQWRKNIYFAGIVEKEYGVKVYIDNVARTFVCAEKIFGLGRKYSNIIAIDIVEGVGAGIIIRNDIYRGNDFIAGEIGHTTIKQGGPKCFCGKNGCAEVMTSTKALMQNICSEIDNNKDSILYNKSKGIKEKIRLEDVFDAYIKGDRFTEEVMEDIAYWLAITIANTVLSYNPEIIIIQGSYIAASEKFLDLVKSELKKEIFPYLGVKPLVVFSELGKYVGPIGSVSLVLSHKINFSTVWD